MKDDGIVRLALFSEDGKYRYRLLRLWDEGKPIAMCVGLNPSTANAEKDDNTIALLTKHLMALGYGSFFMLNLYGLITSKPHKLSECPDPVGPDNDQWLDQTAKAADTVIFCWGQFSQAVWRGKKLKARFPGAMCFGKNNDGSPFHPRALHYAGIKPGESKLINY